MAIHIAISLSLFGKLTKLRCCLAYTMNIKFPVLRTVFIMAKVGNNVSKTTFSFT